MEEVETKIKDNPDFYFHREILCRSLEGRPMEMINLQEVIRFNKLRRKILNDVWVFDTLLMSWH
jgi:hypothetical protein